MQSKMQSKLGKRLWRAKKSSLAVAKSAYNLIQDTKVLVEDMEAVVCEYDSVDTSEALSWARVLSKRILQWFDVDSGRGSDPCVSDIMRQEIPNRISTLLALVELVEASMNKQLEDCLDEALGRLSDALD